MLYGQIIIFAIFFALLGLKIFNKFKILDKPGPDLPPRKSVPTMQGIFLVIGFLLTIGIFFPEYIYNFKIIGYLLGVLLLFGITLLDELQRFDNFRTISPKLRLICQILATLIVFYVSNIGFGEIVLPDNYIIKLPVIISLIITLLWFIGFMNAINWFDGVYGLASGVSSVGFLTINLLIQYIVLPSYHNISTANLEILHIVMNLSFILFVFSSIYAVIEFKPWGLARDIGIMFLGFSLAYLSLLGGAKIGTILVVLSLVIFDASRVFINRIFIMRKNPLQGDYTHLHYRLLALNWNRHEIRIFIRGWSIFLMILMLLQGTNRTNKLIIFLLMFIMFFGINIYLFWIKKLPSEFKIKKKFP